MSGSTGSVSIVTRDGEEVTVTAIGVLVIEEPGGLVTTITVREAVALARTRQSRGVQIGNDNYQSNHF
jgi:hypothetical protein